MFFVACFLQTQISLKVIIKIKKRLLLDLNSSRQQLVSLENSVSSLKNQLEEFQAENTRLIKDLVIFFLKNQI